MTERDARALVLGGGGITGIAWELGMLAGLAERGEDLTAADLVVGTSPGSVVGADVRSGTELTELYERQLVPPDGEIAARMDFGLILRYLRAGTFSRDPVTARRRIGALALRAKTESEEARRKVIESRLPLREWPVGLLRITAVDAESGEFRVFDAVSGVTLLDAVGASCAVPGIWPPVSIDGRRYIDGGIRSVANADLAASYRRVVVIAPLTQGFSPGTSVRRQVRRLTAAGSEVLVIKPDRAALRAIGRNVLDPARRAAAARAGHDQAAWVETEAKSVWK